MCTHRHLCTEVYRHICMSIGTCAYMYVCTYRKGEEKPGRESEVDGKESIMRENEGVDAGRAGRQG